MYKPLYNFSNISRFCIIGLVGIFGYLTFQTTTAEVPMSALTSTMILSSYTNNEPTPASIPNLSFAKSIVNFPAQNFTCSSITFPTLTTRNSPAPNITWYYYKHYSNLTSDTCSQSTVDSTMSFSRIVYTRNKDNFINYSDGTISAGPFINQNVTRKITTPITSQKACDIGNPVGLEIIIGNVEFNIVNGPNCVGILISEYCPGIHYVKLRNSTL